MIILTILLQTPIDPDRFNGYLLLGYGVMWLIGFAYMLYLFSRQRNIQEDVRVLTKLLQDERDV